MKYIAFLMLSLTMQLLQAQSLDLKTLIQLHNNTKLVEVEDVLMDNGFEYTTMKMLGESAKELNFFMRGATDKQGRMFSKVLSGKDLVMTRLITPHAADYHLLKKQARELGFNFVRTLTDNGINHLFEKDGQQLSFQTNYFEDDGMAFYIFQIYDKSMSTKVAALQADKKQ